MSMDYVRRYYGVPAKVGGRVELDTNKGTRRGVITSASHYIYVRFDDCKFAVPLHPQEDGLRYLDDEPPPRGEGA